VIRLYTWWNGMARQGRTGWTLVIFGVGYLLWFFKARLAETGPPITGKEWFYCVGMMVLIVLGTINIRMAEMKARRQGTLPLVDPRERYRK
jgi:xanthine/uracil/vitamin C permease (AzgA family)